MKKSITLSLLVAAFLFLMNASVKSQCDNPPIPVITPNGPTTFCAGGSVTLDAGPDMTYFWNTGATTQFITVSSSLAYCVTVTDANGCSGQANMLVNVVPNPLPVINPSGPTTFCDGGSVILNAGQYDAYVWSNNALTPAIIATESGEYSVTVTGIKGCKGIASITVTVVHVPVVLIRPSGTTDICPGGSVTLDAGVYLNYMWSTGATNQTITVASPGVYTVTVVSVPGCTGSASQTITAASPITSPPILGNASFCSGSNSILTTGIYNDYLWSNGATTQSIIISTAGTYFVTVSDAAHCTATARRTVSMLVSPVPTILVTNLANLCAYLPVNLNVNTIYTSYLWNTGATTQGIAVPLGGTFNVTVRSTNGCTGSSSVNIVNPGCSVPTFPATATTNVTATGAMANWIQPLCYYNYTIRISKHNANIWTSYTVAPNTHYSFSGLARNTSYDWQIQTNCNSGGSINSGFSLPKTFTTLARIEGDEMENAITTFSIYPNPANAEATIAFPAIKEENLIVRMLDMLGNVVLTEEINSSIGDNQFQINLADVAKGIYIIMLQNETISLQRKMVVQ